MTGTLNHVTEYTGFSGDPALQEGNFLALKFTAPAEATTTVELIGGHSGPVELDSDMNAVLRIENKETQKVKVMSATESGVVEKTFDLTGLILK